MDNTDAAPQARPRRGVIAAGLGGAGAALLPFLGRRAAARPLTTPTDPDSGATSTTQAAAPTTTLPPVKRPTENDVPLLSFAQSVELAIRDLYDVALGAGVFDAGTAATISTIREAHEAYAQSISGLITRQAPNVADDALVSALKDSFSGSSTDVATAAAALENQAVATHLELVGALEGIDGSTLIASILIVEARHATVLNDLAGATELDGLLASEGEPLSANN